MDYKEDLAILRDLYYRLSEKKIFFEEGYNDKPVYDYIKDYCEKYDLLDRYDYLCDHIWLLQIACWKGRDIQQEEVNGTLGLNDNDRALKDTLENWDRLKNDDWDKKWIARNWNKYWGKSTNKEKFIQEYGKKYIDEIIKEVEKMQVADYIKRRKEKELKS